MGFILIALFVIALIGSIAYWGSEGDSTAAQIGVAVAVFICTVVCVGVWATSYDSYVTDRTFYDATREQYANSVEMYHDYALLDLKGAAAIAFTDFKYQDYQKNMASFIYDLRRRVVKYNESIVSKRVMKRNFIFNWMIVAPDEDMKIIKMTSKALGAAQ